TRWGLPCRPCRQDRGALLPHPFDLTRPKASGMLSVALSLTPAFTGTAGRYPAPQFRGARTFLAGDKSPPRPPGPLAYQIWVIAGGEATTRGAWPGIRHRRSRRSGPDGSGAGRRSLPFAH